MKTFSAKPHEVKRDWYVVDANEKVLGRVAVEVARRLRGKHKAEFSAWRWERLERLPELIVPFKRGVYEQVVAAFRDIAA